MRALYHIDTSTTVLVQYLNNKRSFLVCHAILGMLAVGCAFAPGHFGTAAMFGMAAVTALPCTICASNMLDSSRCRYDAMGEGVIGAIVQATGIALLALYITLDPQTTANAQPLAFLSMLTAFAGAIALAARLAMKTEIAGLDKVNWNDVHGKVAHEIRLGRERRY